jgi:hypothetical protein
MKPSIAEAKRFREKAVHRKKRENLGLVSPVRNHSILFQNYKPFHRN